MYARATRSTITTPDDGKTVEVCRLGYRALDECEREKRMKSFAMMKEMGADLTRVFQELQTAQEKRTEPGDLTPEQERQAIYDLYDKDAILRKGVTMIEGETQITPDVVGEFSADDSEAVFKAIVDLSRPPKSEGPKGSDDSTTGF